MSGVAPDVIVTWLQNDRGTLGRAAECVASALQQSRLARQVAYLEPRVPGAGEPHLQLNNVDGVHVYEFTGGAADGADLARAVVSTSGLTDPIFLNFGVGETSWTFQHAFAPFASSTGLVVHDLLERWPGIDAARAAHLARIRRLLIRSSDHVLGLSMGAIADVPGAVYLGHGCDPGMEDPVVDHLPVPEDLASIPHPRAMYFGALNYRVDVGAMRALAASGVHVVLVGFAPSPPIEQLIAASDHVHFLGPRPPGASRPYLRHCDLGIVPHTDEPMTWTMEPHKVYNYSCAGMRTVILNAAVPVGLAAYAVGTSSVDAFVAACHAQLARGRLSEAEVAHVRTFTWTAVAQNILDAMGVRAGSVVGAR